MAMFVGYSICCKTEFVDCDVKFIACDGELVGACDGKLADSFVPFDSFCSRTSPKRAYSVSTNPS